MKSHVAALALSFSFPVFAHQVIGINDGATLTLLVDEKPLRLRLADVEPPEKGQAFARQSRQSLHELCFGKEAHYKTQDVDRSGTQTAVVTCDGIEANRAQIERGMAWVSERNSRDYTLPAVQLIARRDRKGLWADEEPVPPWEFRRAQIRRVSTGPSRAKADPAFCYIDRRGEYRIIDGVRRYGC